MVGFGQALKLSNCYTVEIINIEEQAFDILILLNPQDSVVFLNHLFLILTPMGLL